MISPSYFQFSENNSKIVFKGYLKFAFLIPIVTIFVTHV